MSAIWEQPFGLAVLGREPHVFHCHHYNCYLQSVIEEPDYLDGKRILFEAAEEVAAAQLPVLFADGDAAAKLSRGAEHFRRLGFGLLSTQALGPDGGTATVAMSHYGYGWKSRFGTRQTPACHFVRGYLAGLTAHAFGAAPGSYDVEETACMAQGADKCEFRVVRGSGRTVATSVSTGTLIDGLSSKPRSTGNIDEAAVLSALAGMPLEGNEEGMVGAFGVYLTRHYANYYNRVCYAFSHALQQARGAEMAVMADALLVEAGHICAFHTFGGIMQSPEWEGLIAPMIQDREDWVYGITSVVNALGWGRWTVDEIQPGKRLAVSIEGSYESNGYLAMYGKADRGQCHLARGGVAGIMNLLYHGDVTQGLTLDTSTYNRLFSTDSSFYAEEITCRSKGDSVCTFVAEPTRF